MKSRSVTWQYLSVVFVLSYLWQLAIYLAGGIDSRLFPFVMLFPAIVAIAFRIFNHEGFRNVGWGLRRWWYLIPAIMVPIMVVLGVGVLLTSLNWATLSGKHFLVKDGLVEIHRVPLILGNRTQHIAFFTLNFVLSLFVQSLAGSIATIGEEFGWRGYAQEKLIRRFGFNRGLILLGVVWGYWHLPVILMGYNFPHHKVLGALLLMPIGATFMGVFLGWIYLRSKSIWMPTLAHAAMNLCGGLLLTEMITPGDELLLQSSWIAGWGLVAVFCVISLNRAKPTLWQATDAESDNDRYAQSHEHAARSWSRQRGIAVPNPALQPTCLCVASAAG